MDFSFTKNNTEDSGDERKIDEKKIFKKLRKRDKDAFIKAYDLYVDQVYRFVYFKVSNPEDAHDITSAVFLKTWNYIQNNKIKSFKTFKALIYTIARTTIIDHYRKNQANTISLDNENFEIDVKDEKQDLEKDILVKDDFEKIKNKLYELKDEYREIIVLKYIDELSVSEIAQILSKSKGNIRVLIHRSLQTLRKLFEEPKK